MHRKILHIHCTHACRVQKKRKLKERERDHREQQLVGIYVIQSRGGWSTIMEIMTFMLLYMKDNGRKNVAHKTTALPTSDNTYIYLYVYTEIQSNECKNTYYTAAHALYARAVSL